MQSKARIKELNTTATISWYMYNYNIEFEEACSMFMSE